MPKVLFYAAARAAAGVTQAEISAQTLGELVTNLGKSLPALGKVLPGCSYLLNGTACTDISTSLSDSDQIDVLPRFAGG